MKRILALVLIAFCAGFYFTPHLAVRGLQSAIEARDAERISRYVDFALLRENLKARFGERLRKDLAAKTPSGSGRDLAAAFGAAILSSVLDPMIDVLVTPEGLARMMAGEALLSPPKSMPPRPAAPTPAPPPPTPSPTTAAPVGDATLALSYESFDRVLATRTRTTDRPGAAAALVLTRDGWFSWKVTDIRLPD